MSKYTSRFIAFAEKQMAKQGELIRNWLNDPDPLLQDCCKKIIEASGQAREGGKES